MVAFALLFFLLLVSVITAVAIMAALKLVDFIDASEHFYRETGVLGEKLDEIIRLLKDRNAPPPE